MYRTNKFGKRKQHQAHDERPKKNGTDKPTCRIATPSVHRDRPRSGLEKNIWRDVIGGFRQMVENSGTGGGVTSLQSAAHASRASADVRAEAS